MWGCLAFKCIYDGSAFVVGEGLVVSDVVGANVYEYVSVCVVTLLDVCDGFIEVVCEMVLNVESAW